MGGSRAEVTRAIADLKQVGFWRRLTVHLYRIDLVVKPGRASVPEDRHLADARFWRATIAHGTYDYPTGRFCGIRFFPAAMADDLYRWRSLYAQGLTGRPPPSERSFWAGILGHELSHCPDRGGDTAPEAVALAWERRILERLASAGIE
jgi:hypothetical protein